MTSEELKDFAKRSQQAVSELQALEHLCSLRLRVADFDGNLQIITDGGLRIKNVGPLPDSMRKAVLPELRAVLDRVNNQLQDGLGAVWQLRSKEISDRLGLTDTKTVTVSAPEGVDVKVEKS